MKSLQKVTLIISKSSQANKSKILKKYFETFVNNNA